MEWISIGIIVTNHARPLLTLHNVCVWVVNGDLKAQGCDCCLCIVECEEVAEMEGECQQTPMLKA